MLPDKLQPYAKAIRPALLTGVAVLGSWIVTGELNRTELAVGVTGGLSALVTLITSNGPVTHVEEGDPVDDDGLTTLGTPTQEIA